MADHQFSTPWTIEEQAECFIVTSAGGYRLAYCYYEENEGRRNLMHRMTKRQAWNLARAITALPELREEVREVLARTDDGGSGSA